MKDIYTIIALPPGFDQWAALHAGDFHKFTGNAGLLTSRDASTSGKTNSSRSFSVLSSFA